LPKAWGEWALAERPTWTAEHVRSVGDQFRDYWIAVAGAKGVKLDWLATWRNWIRTQSDPPAPGQPKRNGSDAWWISEAATMAKGQELGMHPRGGESWDAFRGRIRVELKEASHGAH
jgi:hypothetical protein